MCKVSDALEELSRVEHKFLSIAGEFTSGIEQLQFKQKPNRWQSANMEGFDQGILFSSFTTSTPESIKGIAFMPKNTRLGTHEHEDVIETITVISGKLHYEIYSSVLETKGELVAKGSLLDCQQITIYAQQQHVLFTAEKDTYLYVTFKKEANGKKDD